jgi:ribosomal protein L37AE/L43A
VSDEAVIDGEATEVAEERPAEMVVQAPTLAVTPQVKAGELVERMSVIREAAEQAMEEDVDYGVIPGTNKPTLLKPGAEKLGVLFQLDIQIANEKVWGPDEHLTVISKATAYFAPTGTRLGFGEGICSTKEKKYAKRQQQRTCPECGEAAVIKGKAEYGGGWLCFKKKGGCGHKWPDGAEVIEKQTTGEIDNPEIPDTWNTVVKMAEKRARVDAVLAVTGASALFTQDVEDQPRHEPPPVAPKPIGQDRAADLLNEATVAGVSIKQIAAWMKQEGVECPPVKSGKDALAAIAVLTPDLATRFEAAIEKEKAAKG